MSNDPIREWILSEGKAKEITRIRPGGGCINLASPYDTDASSFFVKTNRSIRLAMFEGEAQGLSAMYDTGSIRVPRPFKPCQLMVHVSLWSSLNLEHLEAIRGPQSALGRKLAEMHKAGKSEKGFGFDVEQNEVVESEGFDHIIP